MVRPSGCEYLWQGCDHNIEISSCFDRSGCGFSILIRLTAQNGSEALWSFKPVVKIHWQSTDQLASLTLNTRPCARGRLLLPVILLVKF